jgi:hypothetical protein
MNIFSFLKPQSAFEMLRKGVEKNLNEPIPNFNILYLKEKDSIKFEIPLNPDFPRRKNVVFEYENDTIKKLIHNQIQNELKKGQLLDFVILSVQGENYEAKIYFTEDGEKTFTNLTL